MEHDIKLHSSARYPAGRVTCALAGITVDSCRIHFVRLNCNCVALAHRQSADFDFFSLESFEPEALLKEIPYLAAASLRQSSPNTLTMIVERRGPVQLSYFGGLGIGQVAGADTAEGPGFKVASLIDLAGMKVAVLPRRVLLEITWTSMHY